jgi:hypothetical protein
MTISTACPSVLSLRTTIERYILDLYLADGVTLRPEADWPGYYSLPAGSRIPAVYVVGAAMVPSDWAVTGIECTLTDVPEIASPGSVGAILSLRALVRSFHELRRPQGHNHGHHAAGHQPPPCPCIPPGQCHVHVSDRGHLRGLDSVHPGRCFEPPDPLRSPHHG